MKIKRSLDAMVAGALLILLAPLIAVLAIVVWADVGRPIFFRQRRPGLNGRAFEILKFRTMRNVAAGSEAPLDAERLTRLGRWLRAASLDELPELWNVLRGEMSLVGPRPLLMHYLPLYSAEQMRRHEVRPGITGWAQVNGRNALTWEEKFRYDVWYVDNQSLLLDVRILLLTVTAVALRRGISHQNSVTMPEFTGNAAHGEPPVANGKTRSA